MNFRPATSNSDPAFLASQPDVVWQTAVENDDDDSAIIVIEEVDPSDDPTPGRNRDVQVSMSFRCGLRDLHADNPYLFAPGDYSLLSLRGGGSQSKQSRSNRIGVIQTDSGAVISLNARIELRGRDWDRYNDAVKSGLWDPEIPFETRQEMARQHSGARVPADRRPKPVASRSNPAAQQEVGPDGQPLPPQTPKPAPQPQQPEAPQPAVTASLPFELSSDQIRAALTPDDEARVRQLMAEIAMKNIEAARPQQQPVEAPAAPQKARKLVRVGEHTDVSATQS